MLASQGTYEHKNGMNRVLEGLSVESYPVISKSWLKVFIFFWSSEISLVQNMAWV